MSNIASLSQLAFVDETTPGTPPANAAAWESNGQRLRHLAESLDMSGVERSLLMDERNQTRIKATEARVFGIDNPEFPFSVYGHGLGGETNSASQAATTLPGYQLALLLSHAIGGVRRGYATVVSGGSSTTTEIAVASAANYAVGDFVAIELNSTVPAGFAAGTAWVRRITAIDTGATPDTITLDQALPAAPADTDPVHACVMVYFDQSVLADSAGGTRTRTWLVQKGLPSAGASIRESWEFRHCVAELQKFGFTRNETMKFDFRVMASSHASPDTAPWPTTWSNAEAGLAPLAISPITEVWLEDQGATTNTRVHVSSFEVEPGIPRVRNETITSRDTYVQGTYSYSTEPAETTISMAVTPFGIDQWTDQVAATARKLRWNRLGPAGSGFAVHFENVSHIKTPARSVKGANTDVAVQFKAHEVTTLGTSEIQRAGMVLVLY